MKKQFKTREAFLQDTIDYYWGIPERRCTISKPEHRTVCSYLPSETSLGCAIGRLVNKSIANKLHITNEGVCEDKQFDLLPNWMKVMGQGFLCNIQDLHDNKILSNKDKDRVMSLLKNQIDFAQIKFPD